MDVIALFIERLEMEVVALTERVTVEDVSGEAPPRASEVPAEYDPTRLKHPNVTVRAQPALSRCCPRR